MINRIKKGAMAFVVMASISCNFISAGTHGMIKSYDFPVSKYELENVIHKVITNSHNIYRDTSDHGYYNDGNNYLTIKIGKESESSKYIFRYYGDEKMWKASPNSSEIFICYAYNKDNKGGKDGDQNLNPAVRTQLTELFENEFIDKIKTELNFK
jgi:hypothetical protein